MHFIDSKWKLRNLVMGVRHLEEESHTSDLIRDNVENMLDDIALPGTTQVTFTTDGAATRSPTPSRTPWPSPRLQPSSTRPRT
jgi:hypothetical protein